MKPFNIRRNFRLSMFAIAASLIVLSCLHAQQKKKAQAFKNYEASSIPLVLPSTLDLQLLEAFVLMQKANAGESPAQHELGLRYLFGKGFQVDTAKAVYWIQKAAHQNLPLAQFNYGIMLMNGRGVDWNPFEAFEYFSIAAERDVPEALYVRGLMYSENFVVPRSWPEAYRCFRRASELGFEAAKLSQNEIKRRGFDTTFATDSTKQRVDKNKTRAVKKDTSFSLLFIDFHTDTTSVIEDTTLIREVYEWKISSAETTADTVPKIDMDSSSQSLILKSAMIGNPEALCLLGRCYERGLNVSKDLILACVYYLRAFRLDSYRAPALIWKLMHTEDFSHELETRSSRKDPDALYVWSGLTMIGFDKLLSEKQAIDLLQRAAYMDHVPAMVELGSCYFTGRLVQHDRNKAVDWWKRASLLGSCEADIRLAAANMLDQIHTMEPDSALSLLLSAASDGSLLSDLTLAYCYDKGINLQKNKGEAYRIFHRSMLRGSESAYRALRRMHDDMRPANEEFQMPD